MKRITEPQDVVAWAVRNALLYTAYASLWRTKNRTEARYLLNRAKAWRKEMQIALDATVR